MCTYNFKILTTIITTQIIIYLFLIILKKTLILVSHYVFISDSANIFYVARLFMCRFFYVNISFYGMLISEL